MNKSNNTNKNNYSVIKIINNIKYQNKRFIHGLPKENLNSSSLISLKLLLS